MTYQIRFAVLASGSKGNACYVETRHARVLIDAGLSLRETRKHLEALGIAPERLDGVFLTHEHADHIRGAGPLARRYRLPLFMNAKTFDRCRKSLGKLAEPLPVETGGLVQIEDLRVETFTKCHDAVDPMGVILSSNGIRIGMATDLGRCTRLAEDRLRRCRALILEFNHDSGMLANGPYPLFLKRRIQGPDGHLSNRQAGALLKSISHPDLEIVALAHLSETNNTPEKARNSAIAALADTPGHRAEILVCSQNERGPLISF